MNYVKHNPRLKHQRTAREQAGTSTSRFGPSRIIRCFGIGTDAAMIESHSQFLNVNSLRVKNFRFNLFHCDVSYRYHSCRFLLGATGELGHSFAGLARQAGSSDLVPISAGRI
jgi:hypothetical protein